MQRSSEVAKALVKPKEKAGGFPSKDLSKVASVLKDAPDTIKVIIVRHGATKMNNQTDVSQDRIRSWLDVPLVKEGIDEAKETGEKLKGKGIKFVESSDLSRAKETADIIGKIIGVKPVYSHKLRPWDLGEFTGKSTKEALPKIAEYVKLKPNTKIPKGESFNTFKKRAFEGLAEAIARCKDNVIVIVTHHRLERLLEAWAKAGQPADHNIDLKTFLEKGDPPGGVRIIHVRKNRLEGKSNFKEAMKYG